MATNIVNVEDVPVFTLENFAQMFNQEEASPEICGFERKCLGRSVGAQQIGCSHMVVPPGKVPLFLFVPPLSFPFNRS